MQTVYADCYMHQAFDKKKPEQKRPVKYDNCLGQSSLLVKSTAERSTGRWAKLKLPERMLRSDWEGLSRKTPHEDVLYVPVASDEVTHEFEVVDHGLCSFQWGFLPAPDLKPGQLDLPEEKELFAAEMERHFAAAGAATADGASETVAKGWVAQTSATHAILIQLQAVVIY